MPEESAEEQRALIERIKRWPPLKRAEALSKLLDFLFENRARPVSAKYVEEKHFGSNINSPKFNDNRTRVQIRELKEKLKQYGADHQDESLKVELPDAIAAGGYQLTFERAEGLSACKRFWAPHLDSEKPVNVVCDPLLFFWDPEE
ncbi:MAG: hypothetical protein JO323_17820, partial [Acidobacteriia bacterium]|nr:hypothetical protein [Terriglobia bacterium]